MRISPHPPCTFCTVLNPCLWPGKKEKNEKKRKQEKGKKETKKEKKLSMPDSVKDAFCRTQRGCTAAEEAAQKLKKNDWRRKRKGKDI
jgi:hypothetical protein